MATIGIAGLLALAPAGAIAQSESSAAPSASAESVKVGFISPTTGWAAALGIDMQRGWDLFWEQNGPTVGDVSVETVYEDDTADPAVALTKAQRLVEEEGVQFVAGPIIASTAYAVADYLADAGIPTFQITGADDLTQRQFDPLVLRAGYTSSQSNFPAGQWAYDQGYRNAVTICPDYPFGWESCGGFVKAFTDAGGTVTQVWHPLGTQDFGPYVTEVQAANPDVVFVGSAGGPDAILLWQAWTGFGLKDTIPLIGNCCFADQVLLRDQKEAASGITSFSYWTEGRDSEAVRAFVEAYEAKHNEIPSLYAAGSYLMAQLFATTLEQTGGVIDGPSFIEAASNTVLDDSVYGPISFDEFNNIVGGVNREHTEDRGDGALWNVVDETIPDVSQFWTYGSEAFLADPVFSRDYTGQAGAAMADMCSSDRCDASPAPAESAEATS